jgi:hypothetical protein
LGERPHFAHEVGRQRLDHVAVAILEEVVELPAQSNSDAAVGFQRQAGSSPELVEGRAADDLHLEIGIVPISSKILDDLIPEGARTVLLGTLVLHAEAAVRQADDLELVVCQVSHV